MKTGKNAWREQLKSQRGEASPADKLLASKILRSRLDHGDEIHWSQNTDTMAAGRERNTQFDGKMDWSERTMFHD